MKFSALEWCSLNNTHQALIIEKRERNCGCGILGLSIPLTLISLFRLIHYHIFAHSEHTLLIFCSNMNQNKYGKEKKINRVFLYLQK